jgi:outer membrane protein
MNCKKSFLIGSTLLSLIASNAYGLDNGSAGRFIAKAKILAVVNRYKGQKNLGASIGTLGTTVTNTTVSQYDYPVNNTTAYGSVLGIEATGTYFVTDHLAFELGVGYIQKKLKLTGTFTEMGGKPGTEPNNTGNNSNIDTTGVTNYATGLNGLYGLYTVTKLMPINLMAQYHIAPYGKISPYIGVGYNYTLASASSGSKIGSSRGAVFQVGADSFIYNDILINVDLKKIFMTNKVNIHIPSVNGKFTLPTQKITLSPWLLSIGLGYRF